ncbi:FKBP-type peptidyl-prolyl cis-trans isomerase [Luteithermobacter gelatinilyticus]|uniref:FKBP-type peptidyl-prolyl cis-trans isomerase n=1 Tax=Luteithermobacter gelatinilyticus TaxID=2582913 RepID=UPI001106B96A|nr:FKBP-type peptidyl-prolyl cis-trans isomerase [Luteithermobacter gelatinilyticus]|tara:strand:+ start:4967 stop:5491 length:525 start_codon:yes stop_codon:yes gene_type:complete
MLKQLTLFPSRRGKILLAFLLGTFLVACSDQDKTAENSDSTDQNKEENVSENKSFLELNKDKPGVIVTESGLQYIVLLEGTGKKPKATDTVTVNYEGTLTDGTKFDSSYDRGAPLSFPLNRVIPGWTEGLQLMREGAKYKFFIPSDLAYGPHGAGNVIGPNEDLIFTVELIRVN